MQNPTKPIASPVPEWAIIEQNQAAPNNNLIMIKNSIFRVTQGMGFGNLIMIKNGPCWDAQGTTKRAAGMLTSLHWAVPMGGHGPVTLFTPKGEQQRTERRLLLGGQASKCLDLKSWPVL